MTSPLRPVESQPDLEAALAAFPEDRSLLLIGGADFAGSDPELVEGIRIFLATLAAHCEGTCTAVVDGGTDAGVMRWFAEARAAIGGTFPLIGVAPRSAFERPTRTGRSIEVAHGHSLVLAVPGVQFGDELPWLFAAADHLSATGAAPTVLVNGGERAATEARARLAEGHIVVAVAGSGRAADELAGEAGASDLHGSGRLRVIPLAADGAALATALEEALTE